MEITDSVKTASSQPVVEKVTTVSQDLTQSNSQSFKQKRTLFRVHQVVWYIVTIVEILLIFRFFLQLFGANSDAPFVAFVYNISMPFIYPFSGIFPSYILSQRTIIEWSALIGIGVYAVLGYIIVKLFLLGKPVNSKEVDTTLSE